MDEDVKENILKRIYSAYFHMPSVYQHSISNDTLELFVFSVVDELKEAMKELELNYPDCFKISTKDHTIWATSLFSYSTGTDIDITFAENCDIDSLIILMRMRGEFV